MRFYFPLAQYLGVTFILLNTAYGSTTIKPLITLTLGPDFITQGRSETLSLYPPFENKYTNTQQAETSIDGGAFVGIEQSITENMGVQYGIAGYANDRLNPNGEVWLFGSPLFDTLAYQYHIRHSRVVAEGKFLFDTPFSQSLHPYFSWAIGAAFNQASGYRETPLVLGAVPTEPFHNNTQTAVTYGVGIGVDASITQHLRIGAGYQFADFGSVSLGPTPASITSQTLSFPHIYANQLRVQLSILK